ncbi:MAG TPA: DUF4369 domain-containing protein [Flavobacterium sp.]|jgi:hypothetical protein
MKIRIFALLVALTVISCAKKEGNLQISGNVDGLNKGTLYIQKLEDTTLVMLDSIEIRGDSKFETTLQLDSPQMIYLFLDRGVSKTIDNSLPIFAEPGKINVETTLETFFANAKVTGSKNHDLYEEYKKVKSRFTNQELAFTEAELNAFKDRKSLPADHDEKYQANVARRYLYAINFAVTHKDHEIAPYIALYEIPNAGLKYVEMIRDEMTPEVAKSKYGKMLRAYIAGRRKLEPVSTVQ